MLEMVDKNIVTRPVIENLFPFAVNEGLEQGDFNRLRVIEIEEKERNVDLTMGDYKKMIEDANYFKNKYEQKLPEISNVSKIEELLEACGSQEAKKELMKRRVLNQKLDVKSVFMP